METSDDWIVPRTGIRERHFAPPDVGSAALGVKAAEAALADAGLTASDIDFVIFATMTPDLYFPGNGGLLARDLGMKTTHALDIRMQCAGFLSGLQTADAFIRSGMYDRILLVGAEVHSGLMPWPESVWDVMLGKSPGPCDPDWYRKVTACATGRCSSGTAPAPLSSSRTSRATGAGSSPSRCTPTARTGTSSTSRASAAGSVPTSRHEMVERLGIRSDRRGPPGLPPRRSADAGRRDGGPRRRTGRRSTTSTSS